jgi:hypothetical protein
MGLIIGNKIKKFMVGYPTMSDKYNVAGAILSGSSAVKFGDPLMWDSETQNGDGYYVKKAASTVTAANFAGFALATNVKLADGFPGTTVETVPGEALNLLVNGYIAVDIAATTSIKSSILPGAKLYITSAGVLTLTATSNVDTGYVCTGLFDIVEENSTDSNYEYVIEICKV